MLSHVANGTMNLNGLHRGVGQAMAGGGCEDWGQDKYLGEVSGTWPGGFAEGESPLSIRHPLGTDSGTDGLELCDIQGCPCLQDELIRSLW